MNKEKTNEAELYFDAGIHKHLKHDYQSALQDYSKAISLNPDHDRAYHQRGVVYLILGQSIEALADFNKADYIFSQKTKI